MKILKFGTSHCGQCKMQDKELLKIKSIPVEKIDAEENEEIADKYNIMNVPTTIIVNDAGEELVRFVGFVKYDDIEKQLKFFNAN